MSAKAGPSDGSVAPYPTELRLSVNFPDHGVRRTLGNFPDIGVVAERGIFDARVVSDFGGETPSSAVRSALLAHRTVSWTWFRDLGFDRRVLRRLRRSGQNFGVGKAPRGPHLAFRFHDGWWDVRFAPLPHPTIARFWWSHAVQFLQPSQDRLASAWSSSRRASALYQRTKSAGSTAFRSPRRPCRPARPMSKE